MLWAYLTLLAVAVWGLANIIDKYVVSKRVKNPLVPLIIHGFGGLVFAALLFLVRGIIIPSPMFVFYSVLLGMLYFLVILFYFKSMRLEEVSRIIPLMGLHPIVTLIFATIFLGEIFTGIKYLGIFLWS